MPDPLIIIATITVVAIAIFIWAVLEAASSYPICGDCYYAPMGEPCSEHPCQREYGHTGDCSPYSD